MATVEIRDPETRALKVVKAFGVPAAAGAALGLSSVALSRYGYAQQLPKYVEKLMLATPIAIGTSVLGTARYKKLNSGAKRVEFDTMKHGLVEKVASILKGML